MKISDEWKWVKNDYKKQTFELKFLKSSEQYLSNLIKFEFKILKFQSALSHKFHKFVLKFHSQPYLKFHKFSKIHQIPFSNSH